MTCRPPINARGRWHLEGQFILNNWCLVVSHLSQIFVPAPPLCCKYLLGNLSDNAIKDLFSLLSAPHHCWWPHRWLDLESPREILQPVVRICSMSGAQWPCVGPLVKRYITYNQYTSIKSWIIVHLWKVRRRFTSKSLTPGRMHQNCFQIAEIDLWCISQKWLTCYGQKSTVWPRKFI